MTTAAQEKSKLEKEGKARAQQLGDAMRLCSAPTKEATAHFILEDLRRQVEAAKSQGADEDDGDVRLLDRMIDGTFLVMRSERIPPRAEWEARYAAVIAAAKVELARQRENASAAQRKKKSNQDHAMSEAERKLRRGEAN